MTKMFSGLPGQEIGKLERILEENDIIIIDTHMGAASEMNFDVRKMKQLKDIIFETWVRSRIDIIDTLIRYSEKLRLSKKIYEEFKDFTNSAQITRRFLKKSHKNRKVDILNTYIKKRKKLTKAIKIIREEKAFRQLSEKISHFLYGELRDASLADMDIVALGYYYSLFQNKKTAIISSDKHIKALTKLYYRILKPQQLARLNLTVYGTKDYAKLFPRI